MKKQNYQADLKKSFVFNSLYQILRMFVPLATTPYLSRVIGADGIGSYAYAVAAASYFMLFIKLGLANYGNRTIAFVRNDRYELSKTFWSIYATQFVLLCIFLGAYIFYGLAIAEESFYAMLLIPYVASAGMDISWLFWGLEQFKTTAIRDMIVKLASTALIFIFVRQRNDTWIYILIISVSYFISQGLLWGMLRAHINWVRPTKQNVIKHIKPNLTLFVPAVAVSLYKVMDKVMLGLMSTKVEVGYYQNSEQIQQLPVAFVDALGTVMLPRIAHICKTSKETDKINHYFRISVWVNMFLTTSLCFGVMAVSTEFVPLFYGKGFDKCVQVFDFLLPSCIFMSFASVIRTQYLIPKEKDKIYTVSLLSGALVNLVMNAILIPRLQSVGAALGTLAAEASVCLFQCMAIKKEMPLFQYIKETVPFVTAGMVMLAFSKTHIIAGSIGWLSLLVNIAVCAFIYLVALLATLMLSGQLHDIRETVEPLIKGYFKR